MAPYAAVLVAADAALVVLHFAFPEVKLFDLDREYTIAAWFSSLQLALIGVCAVVAFAAERAQPVGRDWSRWLWLPLGAGFFYLSADEILALHERVLTDEVRAAFAADSLWQGVMPWQLLFLPGIVVAFVVIAGLAYSRLWSDPLRRWMVLGGLWSWAASFVLEGAAKPFFIPRRLYRLEVGLEEACELAGATLVLVAFASYAVERCRTPIVVCPIRWGRVALVAGGVLVVAGMAIAGVTVSNPAYLHRRAGDKFVDKGQYDRALVAYRRAAELDGRNPDVWRRYARAALSAREYELAVTAYRRVAELEPQSATAMNDLGVALYYLERYDEAREAYQRAIELSPRYARAYKNLGVLYERLGQLDAAETAYRQALANNGKLADVHRYLGNLLARQNRPQEARRRWKRSLELAPKQSEAAELEHKLAATSTRR